MQNEKLRSKWLILHENKGLSLAGGVPVVLAQAVFKLSGAQPAPPACCRLRVRAGDRAGLAAEVGSGLSSTNHPSSIPPDCWLAGGTTASML